MGRRILGEVVAVSVIHLSYPLAFLAGLVSFLSPCVFPMVPVYLGYLGGRVGAAARPAPGLRPGPGAAALAPAEPAAPLLANGAAFAVGFSAVFITLFYVLLALDRSLLGSHRNTVDLVAGVIVVVLALQTLGLLRIGWLMRERRLHLVPGTPGLLPSFLLGVAFAAGWTPCVGVQLGAILTVAQQGDFAGLPVMVAYCLGLAVPFLLVAALTDRLQGTIRALNRHVGAVNVLAGMLLLVFGFLLIAGQITQLNRVLPVWAPFDL